MRESSEIPFAHAAIVRTSQKFNSQEWALVRHIAPLHNEGGRNPIPIINSYNRPKDLKAARPNTATLEKPANLVSLAKRAFRKAIKYEVRTVMEFTHSVQLNASNNRCGRCAGGICCCWRQRGGCCPRRRRVWLLEAVLAERNQVSAASRS